MVWIRNLEQMTRFRNKPVSFLLSVTNALAWTNALAYYRIRKLRIRSVFIVQTPSHLFIEGVISIFYKTVNCT